MNIKRHVLIFVNNCDAKCEYSSSCVLVYDATPTRWRNNYNVGHANKEIWTCFKFTFTDFTKYYALFRLLVFIHFSH